MSTILTFVDYGMTFVDNGMTFVDNGTTFVDNGTTFVDNGTTFVDYVVISITLKLRFLAKAIKMQVTASLL
ncbi:MAG: hypothetical protein KME21_26070 [Desmonostoc vinosum HA7617-LM4]|jgi:hypothetical protein|nr:hypothetical protein [Desmonostoc vinosum HA7617-LM4]